MKMKKLTPVDTLSVGDFIKAFSSQKAVPITECVGLKVGSLDLFMDPDFEGFFRSIDENVQNNN